MQDKNLDELLKDIAAIKIAVTRNNPLLREVAAPEALVNTSIISFLALMIFAIPAQILHHAHGSVFLAPLPWRIVLCAYALLLLIAGGIAKIVILSRAAKRADREASIWTVVHAFYGGSTFHLTVPPMACMAGASLFACAAGHPWLIVPIIALCIGFLSNTLAWVLRLSEYYALGYWSFASGILALYFVESAPFLWFFIVYGGMFAAFAATALFLRSRRKRSAGT